MTRRGGRSPGPRVNSLKVSAMRSFVIMLSLLLAAPLHAMEIIEEESTLGFSVLVGEREVSGAFKDWSADIDFEARQITVAVRTASATTGDDLLDSILHGAGWLDSLVFPNASFTSVDITETAGSHIATGILVVRDVRLPLTVIIDQVGAKASFLYSVNATLDRTAVGMEGFTGTVSQTVDVTGKITVIP